MTCCKQGNTALHMAVYGCWSGSLGVVGTKEHGATRLLIETLLMHGADVNAVDGEVCSPLQIACHLL